MNRKMLAKSFWIALLGIGISFPVNATIFSIDSFTVIRDDQVLFNDNFSDGVLPPDTGWVFPNGNTALYGTVGTPGPEEDGRLYLDTALGAAQNSEVTGNPLLVQRNRLITHTGDNPNRGLRINHNIAVVGVFDFIAPELPLERYSIRLTDFQTGYDANDNVDVSVRRTSNGDLTVALREADFATGEMNVLDQIFLSDDDFLDFDQIALSLFSTAGSTEVYGGFSLWGSQGWTGFTLFEGAGNIFDGEEWTRAAFIASQHPAAVPEPTSLALLLAGLSGIVFARRKAG